VAPRDWGRATAICTHEEPNQVLVEPSRGGFVDSRVLGDARLQRQAQRRRRASRSCWLLGSVADGPAGVGCDAVKPDAAARPRCPEEPSPTGAPTAAADRRSPERRTQRCPIPHRDSANDAAPLQLRKRISEGDARIRPFLASAIHVPDVLARIGHRQNRSVREQREKTSLRRMRPYALGPFHPRRRDRTHDAATAPTWSSRSVGGHEKLPGDGHEAARWRTWELPTDGQGICPTRRRLPCPAGFRPLPRVR